jgi:hypothetical protein
MLPLLCKQGVRGSSLLRSTISQTQIAVRDIGDFSIGFLGVYKF